MEITDVRVRLVRRKSDRLKAFCSITIDDEFVVRDIRIIDGPEGLFVAMPSRKLSDQCAKCGDKNHFKANFCNDCGSALAPERDSNGPDKPRLHADIAHPINNECRQRILQKVLAAFESEKKKSGQPGYEPDERDDDAHELRNGSAQRPAEGV